MEKFKYLRTPNYQTFLLPNGKMLDVYAVKYDSKVDLKNGIFIPITSSNYKKSTLPTMNDLIRKNIVKVVSCVRFYNIMVTRNVYSLTDEDFLHIQQEFRANGFKISIKALKHNYYAWMNDYKSGYRGNGYHLFSPCGCNTLSFRASTLHKKCKDWQTTYEG